MKNLNLIKKKLSKEDGKISVQDPSKLLAEGIQCFCKVNEGMGLALKVEDGSKRAKQSVGLHILKQLEWISELRIQDIEDKIIKLPEGVQIEVKGQLKFQES